MTAARMSDLAVEFRGLSAAEKGRYRDLGLLGSRGAAQNSDTALN